MYKELDANRTAHLISPIRLWPEECQKTFNSRDCRMLYPGKTNILYSNFEIIQDTVSGNNL